VKYEVVTKRDGAWWAIEVVNGLPKDRVVLTQARRLNDVETMARDAIGLLLDVPVDSFEVTITYVLPQSMQDQVNLFARAEALDIAARAESGAARSRAAAGLVADGLTLREAADILGVSFQRVKQLVDRVDRATDRTLADPVQLLTERLSA
jgi:DNA-directed RNA polymerase specialized sigma24 family protein